MSIFGATSPRVNALWKAELVALAGIAIVGADYFEILLGLHSILYLHQVLYLRGGNFFLGYKRCQLPSDICHLPFAL